LAGFTLTVVPADGLVVATTAVVDDVFVVEVVVVAVVDVDVFVVVSGAMCPRRKSNNPPDALVVTIALVELVVVLLDVLEGDA
jgi:hypothetical protein